MFEIFDDHNWSLTRILKISEKITASDNENPLRQFAS